MMAGRVVVFMGCVVMMAGVATGTMAQEKPQGLVRLLQVSGKCLKVSVARQEMGEGCTGQMGIAVYADGRVGFHFMMRNNHIFSISGVEGAQGRAGVKVDRVVFNDAIEVNKPQVITARGNCTYGDPFGGRMTIRCTGVIGNAQDFVASFQTDGKAPVEAE